MRQLRCKCGEVTAFGSMPPPRCMKCPKCGSDLAGSAVSHRDPLGHEFVAGVVETDDGPAKLSRCKYCRRTQQQISTDGDG